jgi:hypothetical protein
MKLSTFFDIILTSVLVIISLSLCAPVHAKDTGPEAITEAYFFALEHGNYEGAFSLYSDQYKQHAKTAKNFQAQMEENLPQMAAHEGRQIVNSTVEKQSAKVRVILIDAKMSVYAVMISLQIQGGLWRITGGSSMRVGTAEKVM